VALLPPFLSAEHDLFEQLLLLVSIILLLEFIYLFVNLCHGWFNIALNTHEEC